MIGNVIIAGSWPTNFSMTALFLWRMQKGRCASATAQRILFSV